MDFSGPGVLYAFMIVPSMFALVVVMQGFEKVSKHEVGGWGGVFFGLLFLGMIVAAYYLFIR